MTILMNPSILESQGASTRLDTSETDIIYQGRAVPGSLASDPVWLITKMNVADGGEYPELHPNGKADYTNVWNDRVSLIYS